VIFVRGTGAEYRGDLTCVETAAAPFSLTHRSAYDLEKRCAFEMPLARKAPSADNQDRICGIALHSKWEHVKRKRMAFSLHGSTDHRERGQATRMDYDPRDGNYFWDEALVNITMS
jgi:hypothetical protein